MKPTPRRLAAAIAVLVVLAAGFGPAEAGKKRWIKRSARYDAPYPATSTGSKVSRADPTCVTGSCVVAGDGSIDIGGVVFPAMGGKGTFSEVTIQVVDDVNWWGTVNLQYCSSIDNNGSCLDEADMHYANECLAPGEKALLRNVKKKARILVYVRPFYNCSQFVNDISNGQGSATSGVVTVRYRVG